jgi:hypothetical protein
MKTFAIGVVCLLMLASSSPQRVAGVARGGNGFTSEFRGEITDSFCAANRDHEGVSKNRINGSKAGCTLSCVKFGGAKFVLYDPQTRRTYKLDDQQKPEAFAGQNVTVVGAYDYGTKTIRVTDIRPEIVEIVTGNSGPTYTKE